MSSAGAVLVREEVEYSDVQSYDQCLKAFVLKQGDFMEGTKLGLEDWRKGDVYSLEDVKREHSV